MTSQKTSRKTLPIFLLLLLLSIEFCMELRFPSDELVMASKNTEAILRRVPQVEITEEDLDMVEDVSRCEAVRALLESGENGDLSAADDSELMAAADRYLPPESAVTVTVSALFHEGRPSLHVNWRDSDNGTILLERSREGAEWDPYKMYAPNRRNIYENWDNEQAHKTVLRRRWFAWLRDGI